MAINWPSTYGAGSLAIRCKPDTALVDSPVKQYFATASLSLDTHLEKWETTQQVAAPGPNSIPNPLVYGVPVDSGNLFISHSHFSNTTKKLPVVTDVVSIDIKADQPPSPNGEAGLNVRTISGDDDSYSTWNDNSEESKLAKDIIELEHASHGAGKAISDPSEIVSCNVVPPAIRPVEMGHRIRPILALDNEPWQDNDFSDDDSEDSVYDPYSFYGHYKGHLASSPSSNLSDVDEGLSHDPRRSYGQKQCKTSPSLSFSRLCQLQIFGAAGIDQLCQTTLQCGVRIKLEFNWAQDDPHELVCTNRGYISTHCCLLFHDFKKLKSLFSKARLWLHV